MQDDAAAFRAECIETMAREMAAGDGWNYDSLPPDEERAPDGHTGPLQVDYDNRATWALDALTTVAEKHGLKLLGREPSEHMWLEGREPVLYRESRAPQDMLDQRKWYDREKDGERPPSGYQPKGTEAVWTWRAMHDAAVSLLEGGK